MNDASHYTTTPTRLHSSPALCSVQCHPLSRPTMDFQWGKKTPSRRQAMRPIVNIPEEDRATDISSMHKNLVKISRVVPEISSRTDRQTDTETDPQTGILITILRNRSRGRSDKISCLSVTYIPTASLHYRNSYQ